MKLFFGTAGTLGTVGSLGTASTRGKRGTLLMLGGSVHSLQSSRSV